MMDVVLVMFTEKGERRNFPIQAPKTIIGRHTACNIQIPLAEVSRQHCELTLAKDKLLVRDMGSSNGTYINNKRVQQAAIGAGETLIIGPVIFTVTINGAPKEIKPVRTILSGAKKSGPKPPQQSPARKNDDSGSVDINTLDNASSKSGSLAALEELPKSDQDKL
jgi:pSer/pThr/pTyr-binding forkhead associated (FHA) protein